MSDGTERAGIPIAEQVGFALWFRHHRREPWREKHRAATSQECTNRMTDLAKAGLAGDWLTLPVDQTPDHADGCCVE